MNDEMTGFGGAGDAGLGLVLKQLEAWVQEGLEGLEVSTAADSPRELHLEITHRCDLKCVMCHHWEMPIKDSGSVSREMSLAEIREVLEASDRLRSIDTVVVTGGEPLTRPDAPEILALLRGRYPGASLVLLTNLWNTELLRRKLARMAELGVSDFWLGTSIDGVGEIHDRVRGQTGAFAGLERSLAMLREEFPSIRVGANFTITPKNGGGLWDAYRFARDNGLDFSCQFVVNHEGLRAPETFSWREEELAEVEAQIDRVLVDLCRRHKALERLCAGRDAESDWLWRKLLYWRFLRKHGRGSPRFFDDCRAGQRFAMLDPEGNLFFCPVNKHKVVGNVRREPFDRVWESARAERLRAEAKPCQCRCWINCIANPLLDRVLERAL